MASSVGRAELHIIPTVLLHCWFSLLGFYVLEIHMVIQYKLLTVRTHGDFIVLPRLGDPVTGILVDYNEHNFALVGWLLEFYVLTISKVIARQVPSELIVRTRCDFTVLAPSARPSHRNHDLISYSDTSSCQ